MALAPTGGLSAAAGGSIGPKGRPAEGLQAHLLLMIACLPILGILVISPVLPEMQRHFANVPGVAQLVQFALTAPALVIVLISPFVGRIVAAVGRKRALLTALCIYLVAATAPLYLDSLPAIIASRLVVGLAEAILMTVSTMLLGDYFEPARRDRYLAYQVVYTSVSAVLFVIAGGVLGEAGWRVPFAAYGVALLFIPLVYVLLWEPASPVHEEIQSTGRMPWGKLIPVYALTFFAGGCMNLVAVELGYILEELGQTSSALKGAGSAVNSAGIAIGAFLIGAMSARKLGHLVAAFAITAVGYALLALAPNVGGVITGGGLAGLGAGFYLGWLLSAVNKPLSFETRGRGVGIWMASYFLATVVAPASTVGISTVTGGIKSAMVPFACLMAVLTLLAPLVLRASTSKEGLGDARALAS